MNQLIEPMLVFVRNMRKQPYTLYIHIDTFVTKSKLVQHSYNIKKKDTKFIKFENLCDRIRNFGFNNRTLLNF